MYTCVNYLQQPGDQLSWSTFMCDLRVRRSSDYGEYLVTEKLKSKVEIMFPDLRQRVGPEYPR